VEISAGDTSKPKAKELHAASRKVVRSLAAVFIDFSVAVSLHTTTSVNNFTKAVRSNSNFVMH